MQILLFGAHIGLRPPLGSKSQTNAIFWPSQGNPVEIGNGPAAVKEYEKANATDCLAVWEGAPVGLSLSQKNCPDRKC